MKKLTTIFIAMAIISFSNLNLKAQEHKSTIGIDAGVSLIGTLINAIAYADDYNDGSYSTIPVLQVTYDYMITDWLSAGVAGSYQQFNFLGPDGDVGINRSNFAVRALFHYGDSEKLDMYSGVRLGSTIWGYDTNTTDPTLLALEDSRYSGFNVSPQIVAFGIRGYFTDNIGAHIEFGVGAPYYMAGGVNFKF